MKIFKRIAFQGKTAVFSVLTLNIIVFSLVSYSMKLTDLGGGDAHSPALKPPSPADISGGTIPEQSITTDKKVEAVFVLDTTGSMGGLIETAKKKIWSIASTLANAKEKPDVRIALVAYRDKGDAYLTRVFDLTTDLDSLYKNLMEFRAMGGGDTPEAVNQGLHDAVEKLSWSKEDGVYKVVFLFGDAPPHMDYQDDVKFPEVVKLAKKKNITINTIQCGSDHNTTLYWKQIASLSQGNYFKVEQNGGALIARTPYDEDIAKLNARLSETRVPYGNEEQKREAKRKFSLSNFFSKNSPLEAEASRALFYTSEAGRKNFEGLNELVSHWENKKVRLNELEQDKLPQQMQAMTPAARTSYIETKAMERREIKAKIRSLSAKRQGHLSRIAKNNKDTLDSKIFNTIKSQAESQGLNYASGPVY